MLTRNRANTRGFSLVLASIMLTITAGSATGASHAVLPPGDPKLQGLRRMPPRSFAAY